MDLYLLNRKLYTSDSMSTLFKDDNGQLGELFYLELYRRLRLVQLDIITVYFFYS